MLVHFGTRIRLPVTLNSLHCQRHNFVQTLKMAATEVKSKRPICPFCSKPTRICLCNRIQNPGFENSVHITILRHSLERNHPLNSTRIAKLGLKNVTVATVFDVNFEARFDVRLLEPRSRQVVLGREGFDKDLGAGASENGVGLERGNVVGLASKRFAKWPEEKNNSLIDGSEEYGLSNDSSGMLDANNNLQGSSFAENLEALRCSEHVNESSTGCIGENDTFSSETSSGNSFRQSSLSSVFCGASSGGNTNISPEDKILQPVSRRNEEPVITGTIAKYGFISDLAHCWVSPTDPQKPNFDQILSSEEALNALAKGFVVKKMQNRPLSGGTELEEYEEFELEVSPGSVLLFPSERAVCFDDLKVMNIEVKNLIVLDGTWAKAKRMYNENPWLRLLPHLKLDLGKMSLYSEVRHQPKAGYLSTIESIVYTLEALGENSDRLNNLLDVFESMVGDQRRCKDERLSKASPV